MVQKETHMLFYKHIFLDFKGIMCLLKNILLTTEKYKGKGNSPTFPQS